MKVGIAVFAYKRSHHLEQVLEGLKRNKYVERLYVFQDGLKCEADRKSWEETRQVIHSIDWCEAIFYFSESNKGLADSILEGINIVFKDNDAIIVLEDDCVPQPAFVTFMLQCFEKYADDDRIYSVSGYSWPIEVKDKSSDIYFCGRPCPWGWGTWKDCWETYSRDYNLIRNIKRDKDASRRLGVWGDDLENMLITNIKGITDSWYVFWALQHIAQDKYAINPYKSLINNIGFDGTGVHCASERKFECSVLDAGLNNKKFTLDNGVSVRPEVCNEFRKLYGCSVLDESDTMKPQILLYGLGNFYKKNAMQIGQRYTISAFVDKYKKDCFYAGIDIISPREIPEWKYEYVLVMVNDAKDCENVVNELISKYKISYEKILVGSQLFAAGE